VTIPGDGPMQALVGTRLDMGGVGGASAGGSAIAGAHTVATLACLLRRWVLVFRMPFARTGPLRRRLARTLPSRRFAVRFWDRTLLPRRMVAERCSRCARRRRWRARSVPPGQLGIGRAYVAGLLEVDDLDAALDLLADWQPPPLHRSIRARLALVAVCACGLTLPPPCPGVELRPRGRCHSPARDARAARHHYDVCNEFFALFLAPADRHEHRACR
jgi:cyclopropane-fatty-acyl-phospholipid synthase